MSREQPEPQAESAPARGTQPRRQLEKRPTHRDASRGRKVRFCDTLELPLSQSPLSAEISKMGAASHGGASASATVPTPTRSHFRVKLKKYY